MWPNPQLPADLVTFTGEILNEKYNFFVQWVMSNLRICSHLLMKSLMENFIFCAVWANQANIRLEVFGKFAVTSFIV